MHPQSRWSSVRKNKRPQHKTSKSHKTWHQCSLSPLVNFRVISHVLPLAALSSSHEKQKYVLHHSHCVRVFWLPSEEMWSKFLISSASLYAIHDSLQRQILWIDSPFSASVNPAHPFSPDPCANTLYCMWIYRYIYGMSECMCAETRGLQSLLVLRLLPLKTEWAQLPSIIVRLEGVCVCGRETNLQDNNKTRLYQVP